ncbi:MAG: DUF1634 domain-containing protein [Acidimicrobiales bacterium]|nr:DUF1634 domain-containing protein [Acidimicrobiales bacterium]
MEDEEIKAVDEKVEDSDEMRRAEIVVSMVLLVGVSIAATLIGLGIAITFIQNHNLASEPYKTVASRKFHFPTTPQTIFKSIIHGQGIGITLLGLFALILTPIVRVATSLLVFKKSHDTPFVLITSFVLVVLLTSFALGRLNL